MLVRVIFNGKDYSSDAPNDAPPVLHSAIEALRDITEISVRHLEEEIRNAGGEIIIEVRGTEFTNMSSSYTFKNLPKELVAQIKDSL